MTDIHLRDTPFARPTPATLATVKHGGCVQLGDALHDAVGRIFGCDGSPWRTRDVATVLREYAALSAQPSPGGQGDARRQFEAYRGGDFERDAQGYYTNARTAQDWAMWQAALAARQPVGEPVAWMAREALESFAKHRAGNADAAANSFAYAMPGDGFVALYDAPPAQAVDLGKYRHAVLRASGWARRSDVTSHADDAGLLRELLALIDSQAVGNG